MSRLLKDIKFLNENKVTRRQITRELEYRENAQDDLKWDDSLIDFTTEELQELEILLSK